MTGKKTTLQVPKCRDGWNFHVFCLGSSRCSCCGWDRYTPTRQLT